MPMFTLYSSGAALGALQIGTISERFTKGLLSRLPNEQFCVKECAIGEELYITLLLSLNDE